MNNIEKLYKQWQALQPISQQAQERLNQKLMLEFNYNSNHIEGNTLTYGQTELLLLFGRVAEPAIMRDLEADKSSFAKMGITYEEKAFYDILVKVRDDHGFPYAEEKCVVLAREIAKLVNDKAQFADWSTREDIKSQLSMELTVLLYKNGYPPQWDEEVFEKVLEQAENMKKNDAVE